MKRICNAVGLTILLVVSAAERAGAAEPDSAQAKAIAALENAGGKVSVVKDQAGQPGFSVGFGFGGKVTDADLVHLKDLPDLCGLRLGGSTVTDAGLEHVKGLTNIQWLALYQTGVTDAGFEHLKGLTKLTMLDVYHAKVTGAGLEHLKGLSNLTRLRLVAELTDEGLAHIEGLTSLSSLELVGRGITDAGVEHLKGLTNLSRLELCGTQVTEVGIIKVLEPLQKLQRVSLSELYDPAGRQRQRLAGSGIRFTSSEPGTSLETPPTQPPQSAEGKAAAKLEGGGVRLDDKATGESLRQKLSGWSNYLQKVENSDLNCWAMSPDGKLVATGAGYRHGRHDSTCMGSISVWDVATSRRLAKFPGTELSAKRIGSVEYVAFSEDGKTVYYRARRFNVDGK